MSHPQQRPTSVCAIKHHDSTVQFPCHDIVQLAAAVYFICLIMFGMNPVNSIAGLISGKSLPNVTVHSSLLFEQSIYNNRMGFDPTV